MLIFGVCLFVFETFAPVKLICECMFGVSLVFGVDVCVFEMFCVKMKVACNKNETTHTSAQ